MIVGIPHQWRKRTAEGLAATHYGRIRYQVPFQIPVECELPSDYVTSVQDMGANE